MKYPRQSKVVCAESRRVKNSTYGNKISRDGWKQRIHFGEAESGYAPDEEFPDAVLRYMQPQYCVAEKEEKKKPETI